MCVVTVAFPLNWCSNSLMYGMGTDLMFLLPPSFVVGYMTLMNNLFLDVVYLGLYFQPILGTCTNHHHLCALGLSSGARCTTPTHVLGYTLYTPDSCTGDFPFFHFIPNESQKAITTRPYSTRSIRFTSQWRTTRVLGECILAISGAHGME